MMLSNVVTEFMAFALLVVLAVGACAATESASVANGTFEDWGALNPNPTGWKLQGQLFPTGWTVDTRPGNKGSLSQVANVVDDQAQFGNYSLLLKSGRIICQQTFPYAAGQKFRLSLWAKGQGGKITCRLGQCKDKEGNTPVWSLVVIDAKTTGVWKEYSGIVVAMPYHQMQSMFGRIELEGHNVQVDRVAVAPTDEKIPDVVLPQDLDQNEIEFYPIQKKLNLKLLEASDPKSSYGKVDVVVTRNGETVMRKSVGKPQIVGNTAVASMPFAPKDYGIYAVQATFCDTSGKVLKTISGNVEKKRTPWLNNRIGKDRIVIPPFTPIKVSGNQLECWGRNVTLDPLGLPSGLSSQGEDVLSSPVKLIMEDSSGVHVLQARSSSVKFDEISADRVRFRGDGTLSGVSVKLRGLMEYDGMFRYEMDISPKSGTSVNRLYMEIPVRDARNAHAASYSRSVGSVCLMEQPKDGDYVDPNTKIWKPGYEYASGPLDMHSLYFPREDGVIWSSLGVTTPGVYGNFMPSVWLGSPNRGVCWFANNDRGWINDTDTPCFEMIRRGGETVLRVNFISKPALLDRPRKIVFGLIATPSRPRVVGGNLTLQAGSMGFGHPFANQLYGVAYGDFYMARKYRDDILTYSSKYKTLMYQANDIGWFGDPDWKYMRYEWQKQPFSFDTCQLFELGQKTHGPDLENYISIRNCAVPSRIDYQVYRINEAMKNGCVDGLYLDNSTAVFCTNTEQADCGYIRDDGQLQGGCHIFETREFIKRVATLAYQHKYQLPFVFTHKTSVMAPAIYSFADLNVDGEWGDPLNKDFMEFWKLPYLEAFGAVNWGPNNGWLPKLLDATWSGPTDGVRQTRTMLAALKIYDMWIWNTYCNTDEVKKFNVMEEKFGTNQPGCKFVGYWDPDAAAVAGQPSGVKASFYVRPGERALIYFANFNDKAQFAALALDFKKWGIQGSKVTDAETGQELSSPGGRLDLEIGRHDLRALEVSD